jgi:xanthine dehydrogenase accessory factor
VKVVQDWADEAFEKMGLDGSTAVVTLTHDPKLDDPALEAALNSDVFYIGALGSRRTHAKRKERLAEAGISEEQFARVHGPIGLNIGAKSPAEIAVSILGQVIEVRARRLEALSAPKVAAA